MRYLFLFLLLLQMNLSFGQSETKQQKKVFKLFLEFYNASDIDAIFSMFNDDMKKALPKKATQSTFRGIQASTGKILNAEFLEYDGPWAKYKVSTASGVSAIKMAIDKKARISGLLFEAYNGEPIEELINDLSLKENVITQAQADLIFEKLARFPDQTQVAMAIIENGNIRFYGVHRNGNKLSTIENQESIFEIGSISKVFTSTLLAGLVVDKKIKLEDKLNDHLDVDFTNGSKVSFIECANHTSGLPRMPTDYRSYITDPSQPFENYGKEQLEKYLSRSLELPHSAKGKYQYSNLGAGLLGHTLSEIEGLSFEQLLQKRIFSKYKMSNTTTQVKQVKKPLVKGQDDEGKEVPNWEFNVFAGAGGILSNVEDLSKFVIAQFDTSNKELILTQQKTFDIDNNRKIGLGWQIFANHQPHPWLWHNGATKGYRSYVVLDPTTQTGIVLLSNIGHSEASILDSLGLELLESIN